VWHWGLTGAATDGEASIINQIATSISRSFKGKCQPVEAGLFGGVDGAWTRWTADGLGRYQAGQRLDDGGDPVCTRVRAAATCASRTAGVDGLCGSGVWTGAAAAAAAAAERNSLRATERTRSEGSEIIGTSRPISKRDRPLIAKLRPTRVGTVQNTSIFFLIFFK
jgi:hypothetical protein